MYFVVFTFVWARTTVEEVLREVKWVCAHSHWQHRLQFDIYKLRLKSKHARIQVKHPKLRSFVVSFNILTFTPESYSEKANVERFLKRRGRGGGANKLHKVESGCWLVGWFEKIGKFSQPQNVSKIYEVRERCSVNSVQGFGGWDGEKRMNLSLINSTKMTPTGVMSKAQRKIKATDDSKIKKWRMTQKPSNNVIRKWTMAIINILFFVIDIAKVRCWLIIWEDIQQKDPSQEMVSYASSSTYTQQPLVCQWVGRVSN